MRPNARQRRLMADCDRPEAFAIPRVLQWVAVAGLVSHVRVIARSTAASVTVRGAPGRGSSTRPSRHLATNHIRTCRPWRCTPSGRPRSYCSARPHRPKRSAPTRRTAGCSWDDSPNVSTFDVRRRTERAAVWTGHRVSIVETVPAPTRSRKNIKRTSGSGYFCEAR